MEVCDTENKCPLSILISGYFERNSIYEFFVGTNKTVCSMQVSVDLGSTVIFFIVVYATIWLGLT